MTWETFRNGLIEIEKPLVDAYVEIICELLGRRTFNVLEVGSGWGIFARTLLENSSVARLTTIDKIPIQGRPDFNLRTEGFENRIERIVGQSKDVLPKLKLEDREFDLIFVDGAHDYNNCLNDMRLAWTMLSKGGVMMVDDVLHKHNWDPANGDDDFDYGVARAVWEVSKTALPAGEKLEFYNVGSGGVMVIKNNL